MMVAVVPVRPLFITGRRTANWLDIGSYNSATSCEGWRPSDSSQTIRISPHVGRLDAAAEIDRPIGHSAATLASTSATAIPWVTRERLMLVVKG